MNSKNYIKLLLGIFVAVVIVGAIATGLIINKDHVIAAAIESKPLYSQKTIELVDRFDLAVPFGEVVLHSKIYVVHDNDRNVTCYLYDDGISCIPDRFLEEVRKWE